MFSPLQESLKSLAPLSHTDCKIIMIIRWLLTYILLLQTFANVCTPFVYQMGKIVLQSQQAYPVIAPPYVFPA